MKSRVCERNKQTKRYEDDSALHAAFSKHVLQNHFP